jgi:prepilin-type N-terminal cleavage/methylation domain-containing protein/prepilin-type processing-associated H-X9-DG protein
MPHRIRRGMTLVEVTAVVFVVAILASLIVPSLQAARSSARRNQCLNNLRQIGLGLHNYHDTHKCFPPGWVNYTPDAGDRPRLGWQTLFLPFVEYAPIYEKLYPDMVAREVRKSAIVETEISLFRCPSDSTEPLNSLRDGFGTSNYSGNFGSQAPPRWLPGGMTPNWPGEPPTPKVANGIFFYNSNIRMRHCTDGTSYILFVGERGVSSGAGIWMGVRGNNFENDQVTDFSIGNELNSGLASFSSMHKGGANFLFGDGGARFISDSVESGGDGQPGVYQDLGSRDDGRILPEGF